MGVMSEGKEVEAHDERIRGIVWKRLGTKSARQIAEETGLKIEQVFALRAEMLDEVDDLTIKQKRQKLVIQLQEIAQKAQDDYDNVSAEFKAGLLNSAVAAMKTVLVELNRTQKGEQEAIDRLNALRVNELMRLIDMTVARTLSEIATTHELDEVELLGVFQKHLRPVAAELER